MRRPVVARGRAWWSAAAGRGGRRRPEPRAVAGSSAATSGLGLLDVVGRRSPRSPVGQRRVGRRRTAVWPRRAAAATVAFAGGWVSSWWARRRRGGRGRRRGRRRCRPGLPVRRVGSSAVGVVPSARLATASVTSCRAPPARRRRPRRSCSAGTVELPSPTIQIGRT